MDDTTGLRIVGLDISLTSTGMSDGRTHLVAQTRPDDLLEYRMDRVVTHAMAFVYGTGDWDREADLVVIEAGAFSRGSQSQAAEVLSALRFMVRHRLWKAGFPFAMVSPTALKLYTTGSGRATKAQMAAAVRDRHGIDLSKVLVKDGRYDMADAIGLSAMGYAHAGLVPPFPVLGPPAPRASLLSMKWPNQINDN